MVLREFDLLAHVYRANAALGERVLLPPGDDMALLRLDGTELLAAVDQVVGGRHYDATTTPLDLVGRKAIARSLSDVAAMAGAPRATLVAVTLPAELAPEQALELFEAMRTTASRYECPLIGGDVSVHERPGLPLVASVTVLAEPTTARPITRGGARPGDLLYVTGHLGGAHRGGTSARHLRFEPRITEAIELAALLGERLHAMIDISDGLGRDAGHIAEQSSVDIEIEAERLPLSKACSWRDGMSGGEEYELCFAASGDVPDKVGAVPITRVGRVVERTGAGASPAVIVRDGSNVYDGRELGWQHQS